MRKIIALALALLLSQSALAQFVIIGNQGNSGAPPAIGTPVSLGCQNGPGNAVTSVTLTTAAAIPLGALVVVGVFAEFPSAQTVVSVGDGTNSYTQATTDPWDAGTVTDGDIWYMQNAAAVGISASLKATFSGATGAVAANPPVICAGYVTGILSSASLDKVAHNLTSNGTAYSSTTTGTLTQSNEIAFGFMGNYNANVTVTEGAGFTNLNASAQGSTAFFDARLAFDKVAATTALNYQPSTSAATFGKALIATFKGH